MPHRRLSQASRRDLERRLEALVSGSDWVRRDRVIDAVDALRRLETNQYGICVDCDVMIPLARLKAQPEATRCVLCQARQEQFLAA